MGSGSEEPMLSSQEPEGKGKGGFEATMDNGSFFLDCGEAYRYTIHRVIGKGSYGVVCSAVDNYTGERVAVKKMMSVFDHVSDATRILREIKLLRLLKHPDIVDLKHILLPPNERDYKDIFVVTNLMETDLHSVIRSNPDMSTEHHRYLLYQLIRGINYIHSANVFHRDLKPRNILANSDCNIKSASSLRLSHHPITPCLRACSVAAAN